MKIYEKISSPVVACGAIACVSAGLFSITQSTSIQVADSAELVTVACRYGVAHPPGYPLYTLLGGAVCSLPFSTETARLSWLSMIAGVWAVISSFAIVFRFSRDRMAASMAALTLATGTLFWKYSSLPEVFVLNAALCASLVWATLNYVAASQDRARRYWGFLVGVIAGLSLANHHSAVLVFPWIGVAVWSGRKSMRHFGIDTLYAAIGGTIGLSPYLFLLTVETDHVPYWGTIQNVRDLLRHFLREDYGTFRLALGHRGSSLDVIVAYIEALPRQLAGGLSLCAVCGVMVLWITPFRRTLATTLPRSTAMMFALLPFITGPVFFLLFNIDPHDSGKQILERFFVLPSLCFVWMWGIGWSWVATTLRRAAFRWNLYALFVGASFLALIGSAIHHFDDADVSDNFVLEDYVVNALHSTEKNAIILGTDDARFFGMMYAQEILGVRRDVHYIDMRMVFYPWYVARHPILRHLVISSEHGQIDSTALVTTLLRRGHPVYLATIFSEKVKQRFLTYPIGVLLRVVESPAFFPSPTTIYERHRDLFSQFRHRGKWPNPDREPWEATLMRPYRLSWDSIARGLHSVGQYALAQRAQREGERWDPWLKGTEP